MEALFTTLIIDAKESRDIATFDVPGAFIQPELPKGTIMVLLKLKGIFVNIMCEANEEYRENITYKHEKRSYI